jgi:hypothetical protein
MVRSYNIVVDVISENAAMMYSTFKKNKMGTSFDLKISKDLHDALERSSSKFPLSSALKAKVVPSFRESSHSEKCIKYDKIIELMQGKYTKDLYDRHASVLEKMARILISGIVTFSFANMQPVSDIDNLLKVLRILKERIDAGGNVLLDSIPNFVALFS